MTSNQNETNEKLNDLSLGGSEEVKPKLRENRRLNLVKTKLGPRPSRSMYVPIQKTFYGPKATLKEVSDDYLM